MTPSKFLPPRPSFESIRKQAKKLVRQVADSDPVAVARIQAQHPDAKLPLSLRDAQLVLAREYGFAGWHDLRESVLRQEGKGLEWAAAEAEHAIHDKSLEKLTQLVRDYPPLISWRGDHGESLLGMATDSFGDSADPAREQLFTRAECAEFLLDAGAVADLSIWEAVIGARAKGILELLARKCVVPRKLEILTALNDAGGVLECLRDQVEPNEVSQAFLFACRYGHREIAGLLLDRCLELDRSLEARVEGWRGRSGLIDYLVENPQIYGNPWQPNVSPWHTVVMAELYRAMHDRNLELFGEWLRREPDILSEAYVALQVAIVEHAIGNDLGHFFTRFLEFGPALLRLEKRPPTVAMGFALEYGRAHLIPLLTPLWPIPDDLCHAAGTGDFARVKGWFDEAGRPQLGSLDRHHPTNSPYTLKNLHWGPPNVQQVLDVALAWACMNRQLGIAGFLLEHGADVNTTWSTHEPASILHECAMHRNFESAQFLIDHGIDMTTRDYRWNGTAEGWAFYAAEDKEMAEFLAKAEEARKAAP